MERVVLGAVSLAAAARRAAEVLQEGGIVLYPTDTVYGLAVNALDEEALARLQALKGREAGKPFLLAIAGTVIAARYATITPLAQELAERYWPGALTLVLDIARPLSLLVSKNGTVALRAPAHPFCIALSAVFGEAYTSTSANRAGEAPSAEVDAILTQLGDTADGIALVIDGGALPQSSGSTIIDARGATPIILRQGALTLTDTSDPVSQRGEQ